MCAHIPSPRALQTSIRRWIGNEQWNRPFAVTLTMKQGQMMHDGDRQLYVALTPEIASQNLRHFLNVLNRKVFGSASKRHGKRVNSVAVLEGGNGKRLHYHLILDCPRDEQIGMFPLLIDRAWQSTNWSYDLIDIKQCDDGWLNYMTKLRDKPDFASSFDWMNTALN